MKAVSNKTVSCNHQQHIPAALQILNPFSLGQHPLTTLQRLGGGYTGLHSSITSHLSL